MVNIYSSCLLYLRAFVVMLFFNLRPIKSVFKMPHSRKDHGDLVFVSGSDNFLVPERTPGLDNGGYPLLR